jgi:hypothetical protein
MGGEHVGSVDKEEERVKEQETIMVGGKTYLVELGQESEGVYWACCTYGGFRVHGHGTKEEAIKIVKKALIDVIAVSPN